MYIKLLDSLDVYDPGIWTTCMLDRLDDAKGEALRLSFVKKHHPYKQPSSQQFIQC